MKSKIRKYHPYGAYGTDHTPTPAFEEYAACHRAVHQLTQWLARQLHRHHSATRKSGNALAMKKRLDEMREIYIRAEYLLSSAEGMADHAERTNRMAGGQSDE